MANDFISRQAAIDAIITLWADKPFGNPALTEIKECMDNLPSAEPEIIRCKDCKYYDGSPCEIVDWYNTSDDFCSYAERRTDERA